MRLLRAYCHTFLRLFCPQTGWLFWKTLLLFDFCFVILHSVFNSLRRTAQGVYTSTANKRTFTVIGYTGLIALLMVIGIRVCCDNCRTMMMTMTISCYFSMTHFMSCKDID